MSPKPPIESPATAHPVAARPPAAAHLDREILALAVPNFLSTITVPLIGIADTALVGHLGPVAYLGAVSVGSVLFDTLYWTFGFLRMGTTALVAQAYGAGQDRRAGEILIQSALVAVIVGAVMLLARAPITDIGIRLAGGTAEVQHWARAYVLVRILGAPAVMLTFALNGFFRGMKDAVTPLVVTVTINVLNVVGDIGLIYGRFGLPRLGVIGAAWASLIAVAAGLAVALAVALLRYRRPLAAALPGLLATDGVLNPRRLRRLASTHSSLFGRTLFLMAAYFVMVATAARLGEVALAANAIALQLWHITAFSVDGVAHAAETLIGNALGAGAGELTRRLARRTLLWGLAMGGVFAVIYLAAMPALVGIFTDSAAVIEAVLGVAVLVALTQPINAVAYIYDGVFIGANDMPYLFKQIGGSFALVFVPALVLLVLVLDAGLPGLWTTMVLFMIARAGTLVWRFRQPTWIEERLAESARGVTG